jgi:hypothetical protein
MKSKYFIIALFIGFGGLLSFVSSPLGGGKCTGDQEYAIGLTMLDKYKLIKDYRVSLKGGNPEKPPTDSYMISLKAGLKYRLIPISNPNNKTKMIMSIYLNEQKTVLLATSFNKVTGKHYPKIDFNCRTTGTFYLFYEFDSAEKGCGVGMFSVEN